MPDDLRQSVLAGLLQLGEYHRPRSRENAPATMRDQVFWRELQRLSTCGAGIKMPIVLKTVLTSVAVVVASGLGLAAAFGPDRPTGSDSSQVALALESQPSSTGAVSAAKAAAPQAEPAAAEQPARDVIPFYAADMKLPEGLTLATHSKSGTFELGEVSISPIADQKATSALRPSVAEVPISDVLQERAEDYARRGVNPAPAVVMAAQALAFPPQDELATMDPDQFAEPSQMRKPYDATVAIYPESKGQGGTPDGVQLPGSSKQPGSHTCVLFEIHELGTERHITTQQACTMD